MKNSDNKYCFSWFFNYQIEISTKYVRLLCKNYFFLPINFITVKPKKPKIIHVRKSSLESQKNISTTIPPRFHGYDCASSFGNVKHIFIHSEYHRNLGKLCSSKLGDNFALKKIGLKFL